MEKGESSNHPYKRTTKISRRPYMTEWLQGLDATDLVEPLPLDEEYSPPVQTDQPSDQHIIETTHTSVLSTAKLEVQKPELKSDPPIEVDQLESNVDLLQPVQLQQEMNWMREFNRSTLGDMIPEELQGSVEDDTPLLPLEQKEDSDPLKYIQEPPEEDPEEDSEEDPEEAPKADPEEMPQGVDPEDEAVGENQIEPEGEEEEDDGGNEEPWEDEDEPFEDDEQENEEEEDDDDDDDGNREVVDNEVGTESPTSTITTV